VAGEYETVLMTASVGESESWRATNDEDEDYVYAIAL
jgi:hypothetical protein